MKLWALIEEDHMEVDGIKEYTRGKGAIMGERGPYKLRDCLDKD